MVADTLSCFPKRSQVGEKMLRDKNTQILYYLQTLLTKANIVRLSFSSLSSLKKTRKSLLLLQQVFIYETHLPSQLCQFWT